MIFLENDFDTVMAELGECPRPYGPHLLLKIRIPPEFSKNIIIPDEAREKWHYGGIVGMVLAIGPDCYKPDRFKNYDQPKVGDWVIYRFGQGQKFFKRRVPLIYLTEDDILGEAIGNPDDYTRD
jgi:co-chaperonin GroES (HSP10)